MHDVNPDRVRKFKNAVEKADMDQIRLLLKAGVPANHDPTFLVVAAARGHYEVFCLLISKGADINARPDGKSLLENAITGQSVDLVTKILSEANFTRQDLDHALLTSAYYPSLEITSMLLDAGGRTTHQDEDGDTALLAALRMGNEESAIRLLSAGASLNVRNPAQYENLYKKSPLQIAIAKAMNSFIERAQLQSTQGGGQPARTERRPKPKSITQCWERIEGWFSSRLVQINFPDPFDLSQLNATGNCLFSEAAAGLRESYLRHNGSGEVALIPVPGELAYCMLRVDEGLDTAAENLDVAASEQRTAAMWWSERWFPFASNGLGDLLIVDCRNPEREGQVLAFNHETRRVKRRAKSLLALLHDVATGLEQSKYLFNELDRRLY